MLVLCINCAYAQIPITSFQNVYYQSFNSLTFAGGPSNILPLGWHIYESSGDGCYLVSDGTNVSGDIYSFGTESSSERALGSLMTGSKTYSIGAEFTNSTGAVIDNLIIEYTGEQWSINFSGRHDLMSFKYSLDATSLNSGTWTAFSALDFIGPIGNASQHGALNGNAEENRVEVYAVLPNVNLQPGSKIWIKWVDMPATFTDDGLSIDDFSLQASSNCTINIVSFVPDNGPVGTRVTIEGSALNTVTSIRVNGVLAEEVLLIDAEHLRFKVPVGATTGKIECTGYCTSVSSNNFIVRLSNCFSEQSVIISELCDPLYNYETDRYIEIFNPTSETINLDGWSVRAIANNPVSSECGDMVMCWNLSGSIQPSQAMTCGYSNSQNVTHDFTEPEWQTSSSTVPACYYWNGQYRDGAALYRNEERVDGILRAMESTDWYSDKSLMRSSQVCTMNANSVYTDWEVTEVVTYAGSSPSTPHQHNVACINEDIPEICTQPSDITTCIGSFADFTINLNDNTAGIQYQWKVFDANSWINISDNETYSGTNTPVLHISNAAYQLDGRQYYCQINSSDSECFAVSNAVRLTISPLPGPATYTIWHQENH